MNRNEAEKGVAKRRKWNASRQASTFKNWKKQWLLSKREKVYLSHRIFNAFYRVHDGCVDNYRIMIGFNFYGRKIYLGKSNYFLQKDSGCCGFWDEEVQFNSGKLVMFGFNYGH